MGYEQVTTSSNQHLSNLSSTTFNRAFVGKRIFTPVQSDFLSAAIIKEAQASLFQQLRAMVSGKSVVGEIEVNVSEDLFRILTYALKGYTSQQDIMAANKAGKSALKLVEKTVRKVTNGIELLEELMIAAVAFAAGSWTGQTAAAATKWDQATADPILEILQKKDLVYGKEAGPQMKTKILFGKTAWTVYRTNAKVRAAFQNVSGGGMASDIPDEQACRYAAAQLEVDEVVVGKAQYDDGSGTLVDIWTDNALICTVSEGPEVESGAAGHLLWWGDTLREVVEWFTHELANYPRGAQACKVISSFLPKLMNVKSGYLITDVVT